MGFARYDLRTAQAMVRTKRYRYVIFCSQQAIEKCLKALIAARTGKMPPRIHDLERLADVAGVTLSLEDKRFFLLLTQFYIESRYASPASGKTRITRAATAREVLRQTRKAMEWLRSML